MIPFKHNISLIVTFVIVLFLIWNYQNIKLYFHSVNSIGEKYESVKQIRDDLNVINPGKYKITSVELYTINQTYLDQYESMDKKSFLDNFSHSNENNLLQIDFTDDSTVNSLNLRSKEVVTREAISMLYFLNQRKLMDNVEVVDFVYTVNFGTLAVPGTESVIIPIAEFKEELDKNKEKSIEKTLMKLNLHFYENVLYVNEPVL